MCCATCWTDGVRTPLLLSGKASLENSKKCHQNWPLGKYRSYSLGFSFPEHPHTHFTKLKDVFFQSLIYSAFYSIVRTFCFLFFSSLFFPPLFIQLLFNSLHSAHLHIQYRETQTNTSPPSPTPLSPPPLSLPLLPLEGFLSVREHMCDP